MHGVFVAHSVYRLFCRAFYVRTYGRSSDFHTLKETKAAVHPAIWDLRKELPTPHHEGRCFEVPVWRLGCLHGKNAFVVATGGTPFAHREALILTIAGKHPNDVNAGKAASQVMKSLHTARSVSSIYAWMLLASDPGLIQSSTGPHQNLRDDLHARGKPPRCVL